VPEIRHPDHPGCYPAARPAAALPEFPGDSDVETARTVLAVYGWDPPSTPAPLTATMTGKNKREASMRIKPDGTLDEVWREPEVPWWRKTAEQEYDELLERILRNNPTLTRAKAKEMLDASGRRRGGPFR
jgi:hypothetical protein